MHQISSNSGNNKVLEIAWKFDNEVFRTTSVKVTKSSSDVMVEKPIIEDFNLEYEHYKSVGNDPKMIDEHRTTMFPLFQHHKVSYYSSVPVLTFVFSEFSYLRK